MAMNLSRISAIYRKELVDVLRDHRTLVAMIIVPIVLYPVLILGSLQAVSHQADALASEAFTVAVPSERDAKALAALFFQDAGNEEPKSGSKGRPAPGSLMATKFYPTSDVCKAVEEGSASVGLRPRGGENKPFDVRAGFDLIVDEAEIRSEVAAARMEEFFERLTRRVQRNALREIQQPEKLLDPIPVDRTNIAKPEELGGSVLSHIVPLVLVLMAVTGAIYPAIDLTAGERERGTLETLVACPIPVEEIVIGKFLVVTTLSLFAASLNLASIGLTMQVTGVQELLTKGQAASVPFAVLPIVLLSMVPFAVLFSAVLLAVASFAKSFKEAQNLMIPVILASLIPGMAAALPGTRLEGMMLVMPVGNMVLLTREFLLGHFDDVPAIALVLGSTCFYAATAVVAASRLFGQEAVLFSDAASYKVLFRRRLFRPQARPTATQGLLLATAIFPVWFYVQTGLGRYFGDDIVASLRWIPVGMVAIIAGIPIGVALYRKIDPVETFSLRGCSWRYFLAAGLMGCSGWVLVHELIVLQGVPEGIRAQLVQYEEAIRAMPLVTAILLLAVVPGLCEEFLFRGFLLSGLREGRRLSALVTVGVIFGIYHFVLVRFLVTALLGMALAYLCWQSRSIWPCVFAHMLHNAMTLSVADLAEVFGLEGRLDSQHLPAGWIVAAFVLFGAGLWLCRRRQIQTPTLAEAAASDAAQPST